MKKNKFITKIIIALLTTTMLYSNVKPFSIFYANTNNLSICSSKEPDLDDHINH